MDEDSTQETSPPPEDVSEQSQSLHVDDLPDDVLLTVFKRLDIKSRVLIERVSQRWQQLARQLWKSQRCLTVVGAYKDRPYPPGLHLTPPVLEALLMRCNGCVRTLNLSLASRYINSDAGAVISSLCPNLENIDVSGARLNNASVQLLAQGCSKLKTAVLKRCTEVDDGGVQKLLGHCENLEFLNLVAVHKLSGECFKEAGAGLRRLLLDGCWGLTMAGLSNIATKCVSLVELSLSRCIQATDLEVQLLCQNLTALKTFRFAGSFPGCTSASIIAIANLSLLEDLDLSHNRHVTELTISTICKGCRKLRNLDVTGCHSRCSDAVLVALAACRSLRNLKINYSGVSDVGLNGIARQGELCSLEVRGCHSVTNEGVQELVKQCPHLHLLDLTGCRLLDNRLVKECKNIVPERPHVLTLAVGGTRIRFNRLNLDPEGKLKVDTTSVCAEYREDGWNSMLYHEDHHYEMDYWDEEYEDYDGVDDDDDVWDLDGEDLAAEAALADEVLPAGLPPAVGGDDDEGWAPLGYLHDMLDMPPSDDDDYWPFDFYDAYDYDESFSDDEGWIQGYYDFDDPQEEEDMLDDDDLGIGGLFDEPQEDGAHGCAGVADSDHHPQADAAAGDAAAGHFHMLGDPQEGGLGGAQAENRLEVADFLDDPQEEEQDGLQGGVEIADFLDDPQEEEQDGFQGGVEIADFLDDPQEEEQDGFQGGVDIADFLDDPQEEPWTPECSDYEDFLEDPQEVQW